MAQVLQGYLWSGVVKKPFKITYSSKYKRYTVWKRTTNNMFPIVVCAKSIALAWKEAAEHPLYGIAFK